MTKHILTFFFSASPSQITIVSTKNRDKAYFSFQHQLVPRVDQLLLPLVRVRGPQAGPPTSQESPLGREGVAQDSSEKSQLPAGTCSPSGGRIKLVKILSFVK